MPAYLAQRAGCGWPPTPAASLQCRRQGIAAGKSVRTMRALMKQEKWVVGRGWGGVGGWTGRRGDGSIRKAVEGKACLAAAQTRGGSGAGGERTREAVREGRRERQTKVERDWVCRIMISSFEVHALHGRARFGRVVGLWGHGGAPAGVTPPSGLLSIHVISLPLAGRRWGVHPWNRGRQGMGHLACGWERHGARRFNQGCASALGRGQLATREGEVGGSALSRRAGLPGKGGSRLPRHPPRAPECQGNSPLTAAPLTAAHARQLLSLTSPGPPKGARRHDAVSAGSAASAGSSSGSGPGLAGLPLLELGAARLCSSSSSSSSSSGVRPQARKTWDQSCTEVGLPTLAAGLRAAGAAPCSSLAAPAAGKKGAWARVGKGGRMGGWNGRLGVQATAPRYCTGMGRPSLPPPAPSAAPRKALHNRQPPRRKCEGVG